MLLRTDATPDAHRALNLRYDVQTRLKSSTEHLLDVAGQNRGDCDKAKDAIANATPHEKFGGTMHLLHTHLRDAVRAKNLSQTQKIVELYPLVPKSSDDVDIFGLFRDRYDAKIHQLFYDDMDAASRRTYNASFDGKMPSENDYLTSKEAANKALVRLKQVDPEMYGELRVNVSDIMIIDSRAMEASTSVNSLGVIRVSHLRPTETWTRYYETMAHEGAHHHLDYLWYTDPIILNEGESKFSSPLRKEPRPLSGIFHAMFVLARTMRAIDKLEASDDYNPDEDKISTSHYNKQSKATLTEKFFDCVSVLQQNAKFTELGRGVMDSSIEMAKAHARSYP